jgi:hypothetical protein
LKLVLTTELENIQKFQEDQSKLLEHTNNVKFHAIGVQPWNDALNAV